MRKLLVFLLTFGSILSFASDVKLVGGYQEEDIIISGASAKELYNSMNALTLVDPEDIGKGLNYKELGSVKCSFKYIPAESYSCVVFNPFTNN